MFSFQLPSCKATLPPIKKAFAGNPQSKGTVCPNCGKRCTNDIHSAIFHVIVDVIVLAFVVFTYIKIDTTDGLYYMIGAIAGAFLITRIGDAIFFKLVPAIRLNIK